MPQPLPHCSPPPHRRVATLLALAASAAASSAMGAPTVPEGECNTGDEVGLLSVQLRRGVRHSVVSMEPSVVASARPTLPMKDEDSAASQVSPLHSVLASSSSREAIRDLTGTEPSHSPIVVATARELKGTGAFSFSAVDSFMPTNTFREEASGEDRSPIAMSAWLPVALQTLAQAQLWLTCAGGIMVAFALNRARAVFTYYNHQTSQVKEGSTPVIAQNWRIDPDMVRSSAWNSAG